MSKDAEICFKCEEDEPEILGALPSHFRVYKLYPGYLDSEAIDTLGLTHMVENAERFYDSNYAKGDWPKIAATLMTLLASPSVTNVCYNSDDALPELMGIDRLASITRHFVENGYRTATR